MRVGFPCMGGFFVVRIWGFRAEQFEKYIGKVECSCLKNASKRFLGQEYLGKLSPTIFLVSINNMIAQNFMSQEENIPTLYYPAIRGAVQPIRHLFLYLDRPYYQETMIHEKEVKPWFMAGYPRLEHGDIVLTESISIFKYVCKISGRSDLLGLTPQNRAVIHEFLFCYGDLKREMMKKISSAAFEIWNNQEKVASIKLSTLKTIVEECCPMLVKIMRMYMKTKSWLLGYATILDFFFYEICFYLTNFLGSIIINHPIYRNFNEFKKFFQAQISIHQSRASQKKIFAQFKNQETLQMIKLAWQGQKAILA